MSRRKGEAKKPIDPEVFWLWRERGLFMSEEQLKRMLKREGDNKRKWEKEKRRNSLK